MSIEAFQRIMTPDNIAFMLKSGGYSIIIAVCALIGGSVLGLLSASMKMSKHKVLRGIANVYVEVIRGTPMLLQVMLFFLGGPVITKTLFHFVFTPNPYVIGAVAVAINSGAYTTELFRSAIQSVDKGQWEAARTIGLTYGQTMKEIILPQAFKRILPPYINEFIVLLKDSSLLSAIGAVELLQSAKVIGADNYNYLVPLLCATAMYLVMTLTISFFARKLERRLAASD